MKGYEKQTWQNCPRCGFVKGVPAKKGWIYTCDRCGSKNEICQVWVATEYQEMKK